MHELNTSKRARRRAHMAASVSVGGTRAYLDRYGLLPFYLSRLKHFFRLAVGCIDFFLTGLEICLMDLTVFLSIFIDRCEGYIRD